MTGIRRAMPVVVTDDPQGSRDFYVDFLGFAVAMEQDGFLMLRSPSVPTTQVILTWAHPTVMDPDVHRVDISTEVADVDDAHADALARGLEIVYPLTDEPWGIRRFFVREPSGTVVNVTSHIADLGGGGTSGASGQTA
jgi:catechol 2,3-dioxygenase-like lactoylglutathione lyase family enzyme